MRLSRTKQEALNPMASVLIREKAGGGWGTHRGGDVTTEAEIGVTWP